MKHIDKRKDIEGKGDIERIRKEIETVRQRKTTEGKRREKKVVEGSGI